MVPDEMTSSIHSFDAREGGMFRISLTYNAPTDAGKTDPQRDSFHGRFIKLVPDTQVVQAVEFETDDPAMAGEMTITFTSPMPCCAARSRQMVLETHGRLAGTRAGDLWDSETPRPCDSVWVAFRIRTMVMRRGLENR